jgi:WD40 repeat protein
VGDDGIAQVWDLDHPETPPKIIKHSHNLSCVALSSDGKWLATGFLGHRAVHLWDLETVKELPSFDCQLFKEHGAWSLAFHPSARRLAVGTGGNVQLLELDPAGKETNRLKFEGGVWVVTGISFTPDGRYLGFTSYGPGACLLNGETLEKIALVANPKDVVLYAGTSFSADGKRMIYGKKSPDCQELMLWEPLTDQPPRSLAKETQGAVISAVAFAPGGRQIAHGGTHSGPIKLYDLKSGESSSFPTNAEGNVTGLAFSPDGLLLIATCNDGSVLAWDVVAAKR